MCRVFVLVLVKDMEALMKGFAITTRKFTPPLFFLRWCEDTLIAYCLASSTTPSPIINPKPIWLSIMALYCYNESVKTSTECLSTVLSIILYPVVH